MSNQPEIAQQLTACGIPVFPCWDNKQPAIKGGFKAASITPGNYWPSPLIGIPVPAGIIIIDIDSHKGMTTAFIDQSLGCELDWSGSLLHHTPSGGSHHAFRVSTTMRQGSDLFADQIGKGFDTRVTDRGYICAGGAYVSPDPLGVLKLVTPSTLPTLPTHAVSALSAVTDKQHEPTPLPTGDRNAEEIRKMLRCLDADCSRDEWLRVGLALKHHYHDDDETGFILFDNWSMSGGDSYDTIEARKLWDTINPTKGTGSATVTLGTIVHKAIDKGYVPSSIAGEVFGQPGGGTAEPSASLTDVETLIATINAEGGKPEKLDTLTTAIRQFPCNSIQRAALTATLQRTLRDHNIKITERELKQATNPTTASPIVIPQPVACDAHLNNIVVNPVNGLTGDHRCNAEMLQHAIFGDRLARYAGELYWWTGSYWQRPSKDDVNALVSAAFSTTGQGKTSNIDGTHKQLANVAPRIPDLSPSSEKVFFKNGVYDPLRPDLGLQPHSRDNYNTSVLTVNYTPGVAHPEWDKFLHSIFHVEPERGHLLQELMGWMMISGNLNMQKAVAFDGASRGGKGTIIDVIHNILGLGLTSITFGQLHEKQTLSDMREAMVAVDSDAKRPDRNNATAVHSRFNRISANEPVDIKINYKQDNWVGRLNCKLMVACNGIPIIADDSSAAPRRWVVLKFTEDFTGREDRKLGCRLVSETEAISAWAVEGLRRLMQNGQFTLPQSSIDATEELSKSSSPLILFANERLDFGNDKTVHSRLLWDAYRNWCADTNTRNHLTSYNFSRLLKQVLIERGGSYREKITDANGSRYRGYMGVALASCNEGVNNVTPITQASKALSNSEVKS